MTSFVCLFLTAVSFFFPEDFCVPDFLFCPEPEADVFLLFLEAEALLFVDFDAIDTLQSIRGRRQGSNPVNINLYDSSYFFSIK